MTDAGTYDQCHAEIDRLQNFIQSRVESFDVSPALLVAATKSGNIRPNTCSMKSRRVLRGHFGKISAIQWCPSSVHHLVSASQDGRLLVWNALSSNKISAIPLRSAWVMTCSYSPDGNLVASGGLDNVLTVFRLGEIALDQSDDPKPTAELLGHDGYVSSCPFLTNNQILTSSGDSTCKLWDIERKRTINSFKGHYGDVMAVASLSEHTFISGSVDASLKLWDVRLSTENQLANVKTFRGHESDVNCVGTFPDGNAFVSGSDDSTCRLFDIRSVGQVNKYMNDRILTGATACVFSASGKAIFSAYDDCSGQVWDTVAATSIYSFAHSDRISCLGVNADGKALCSGSWDQTLKIWA